MGPLLSFDCPVIDKPLRFYKFKISQQTQNLQCYQWFNTGRHHGVRIVVWPVGIFIWGTFTQGLMLPAPLFIFLHLHCWPVSKAKNSLVTELVQLVIPRNFTPANCVTYRSGEWQELIGMFMLTYRLDRNITSGYLLTCNKFSFFFFNNWGRGIAYSCVVVKTQLKFH
jgi:hypothetical protein